MPTGDQQPIPPRSCESRRLELLGNPGKTGPVGSGAPAARSGLPTILYLRSPAFAALALKPPGAARLRRLPFTLSRVAETFDTSTKWLPRRIVLLATRSTIQRRCIFTRGSQTSYRIDGCSRTIDRDTGPAPARDEKPPVEGLRRPASIERYAVTTSRDPIWMKKLERRGRR